MKVERKEEQSSPVSPGRPAKVSLTPSAAEWIVRLLEGEGKSPAEYGLRIRVVGGGCSGFMYDMRFDRPAEEDFVFERDGAKVLIDPKSMELVRGSTVTYLARLQGAGFTVVNPNATGSCGCGVSFGI